ncbi:hypothetical protein F5Y17DRAFT_474028 [Xylariaceae sp. FL0594]|nr:hypothetical protein F5Y17DRAFT_474028 [Xylariaceae sp. FL0594]
MLHRDKPKDASSPTRKVEPPSPTYMNNEQFANYLASLRENRVKRPVGARPPPPSARPRPGSIDQGSIAGRPSIGDDSIRSEPVHNHQRPLSDLASPRGRTSVAGSVRSRYTVNTSPRKDYSISPGVTPLKPSEVVPSATYIERGQRWMEKEEVSSLRQAMDAIDLKDTDVENEEPPPEDDDETRIYNAALNEAAELVYQHEHGIKPREPDAPYRYRPHMRKNSYAHARTASAAGRYSGQNSLRSLSTSPSDSDRGSSPGSGRGSLDQQPAGPVGSKTHGAIGNGTRSGPNHRRRSSMRRNISGEIEKPFSGDQIWEEPEGSTHEPVPAESQLSGPGHAQPLDVKAENSPTKMKFDPQKSSQDAIASPASAPAKMLSRTEIHKNPPSQSRNPNYTKNSPADSPRTSQDIPKKNGIEIRSDDIRQATSMRLKDRSPKLPIPSAVTDSPGRPIVSFDKNWKAPEEAAADPKPDESRRVPFGLSASSSSSSSQERAQPQVPQPSIPTIVCTPDVPTAAPPARRPASIPSIQVESDDRSQVPSITVSNGRGPAVPTIVLPGDDDDGGIDDRRSSGGPSIPVIVTPDDNKTTPKSGAARPLPTPGSAPPHARNARAFGRPQGHWSPAPGASPRSSATCHECGHAIEGRFVALKGGSERFHPQCFRCYACGTGLEALEISPEPDDFRAARLERIRRRAAGEVLSEEPGKTMAEDGDGRLRFYCHLDWHELFAPRCKHCKTPILGEHVVALGAHWHQGHFFCAECGDPFERGATHIEKDGYAWCVACQTKRTERRAPKCRRCERPVIGQYVLALGAEWHDECFRCADCGGGFVDGQIFPVGEGKGARVLCTGCRARELKI